MSTSFQNLKITIMGLGLHGGGSASARFFAEAGARVTVTDLRSKEELQKSLDALSDLDIRYVLGRHDIEDFRTADIVIKNPAVKLSSPYLAAAERVETDISIFLALNKQPVIAVTGSKGKSTTVSALYHVLKSIYPDSRLGGNITVSPLSFYNEENNSGESPVVLELSSWQLADLRGRGLLKPRIAAITNIMHDHQDSYNSMQDYADDKAVIFESQPEDGTLLLNAECGYTPGFAAAAPSRVFFFSGSPDKSDKPSTRKLSAFLDESGAGFWSETNRNVQILNSANTIKGPHNRLNLLTAAAILYKFGIPPGAIREGLASFPGIAHRLEFVREARGLLWYNDSAATIPEAAAAAVKSFEAPVHLIAGGTDKQLEFEALAEAAPETASISLLAGTATDKITRLFSARGITFDGPFGSLDAAVKNVLKKAGGGASDGKTPVYAVLSPGCASFGMFKNEFDRGDKFRELIRSL